MIEWKVTMNIRSASRSNESMSVEEEHALNQCIGMLREDRLCNSNTEKQTVGYVNSVNASLVTTLTRGNIL
jgi:hypothetical protein